MSKAVLISIQPKWCELIASGKKTVEVRKTKPKMETPFKCYIYETQGRTETPFVDEEGHHIFKGRGQVIGEFVCDKVEQIEVRHFTVFGHENLYTAVGENPDNQWLKHSCLSYNEVARYGKLAPLFGWHISDLVIYDKPRELSEFTTVLQDKDIRCKHIKMRYTINGKRYNKCTLQNCICEYRRLGHQTDCDGYELLNPQKSITRPPQSWCYVEDATRAWNRRADGEQAD